jgi:hypothetical protein
LGLLCGKCHAKKFIFLMFLLKTRFKLDTQGRRDTVACSQQVFGIKLHSLIEECTNTTKVVIDSYLIFFMFNLSFLCDILNTTDL